MLVFTGTAPFACDYLRRREAGDTPRMALTRVKIKGMISSSFGKTASKSLISGG